jgi:hypothetical protein
MVKIKRTKVFPKEMYQKIEIKVKLNMSYMF